MSSTSPSWAVEGPVQAEVFVLRLRGTTIELAGPCGPAPWYLEVGTEDDPLEVVNRLSTHLLGRPLLVHSTSWRRDRGGVILSFVVVIGDDQAPAFEGVSVERVELARNSANAVATGIVAGQVVEHGLRHLAWLVEDDQVVGEVLSERWKRILAEYVPAPFRHLG